MILKCLPLFIGLSFSLTSFSQCLIPNGTFENFDTINARGLSGPVTYLLPQEWLESPIANIFSRFVTGTGFFNKYTGNDANGNALLITRSHPGEFLNQNNGYIRFECNQVPDKLTGRIKFSGSSNRHLGQEDNFTMGVFFSTVMDTLTKQELQTSTFPARTHYFSTDVPMETFTHFEIDLSDFQTTGDTYSYFSILIQMEQTNNLSFQPEYATAVLDDLQFEYSTVSIEEDIEPTNLVRIYPNPVQNELFIENYLGKKMTTIEIIDQTGRTVIQPYTFPINTNSLSTGVYFLRISTERGEIHTHKFIKD